jgi:phytoene synthase
MNGAHEMARQITRRSQSNLAPALWALPRARRRDMVTFYAFCRVIDDIADEEAVPLERRRAELAIWRDGLQHGFDQPDDLQREVAGLPQKYSIRPEMLIEIVDGVTSDLEHRTPETLIDLLAYCYQVASVVGLVSIEIFGYKNPVCRDYAVNLGYALQLTNILRDVAEDARRGRIYLPLEDLLKFGVSREQILALQFDAKVEALLCFAYQRARQYYDLAASLLPKEDRRRMLPAEMMAGIYAELLEKIRQKHFRVFESRIRLSKFRKLAILAKCAVKGWLNR